MAFPDLIQFLHLQDQPSLHIRQLAIDVVYKLFHPCPCEQSILAPFRSKILGLESLSVSQRKNARIHERSLEHQKRLKT